MSEAATAAAPAATTTTQTAQAPAAAAPSPAATQSAGPALATAPEAGQWFNEFKSADIKTFIQEKKFSNAEQLAQSYWNLEKLKGVPEDRLLRLPEKLEGEDAKAVFQRLGAPKEAKEYELKVEQDYGGDTFATQAQDIFLKNNLTKSQGQNVIAELTQIAKTQKDAQVEQHKNAVIQADTKLKSEWGAQYDSNINLAKQGAKILGLDAKTLDIMEALQGRDNLFKNLQRIGVSVGESAFVDGNRGSATETMSAEQAQGEIKKMLSDQKFAKKVARGDTEATAKWNEINRLAYPGEKQII